MSDLIERLRDDEANRWGNTFAIRHEAADEIERLTTENSKLKAALAESCDENRAHVLAEGPWSTDMCPIAGKLTAEVSRLKDELHAWKYGEDADSGRPTTNEIPVSTDIGSSDDSSQCEHVFPPIKFGVPPRTCLLCGEPFTPSDETFTPEGKRRVSTEG